MRAFTFCIALLAATTAVAADLPRVFIEATETVDASNSKDKAKHIDFGSALAAAILKKEVPVLARDLKAFAQRLQGLGVALERGPTDIAAIHLATAFLSDPAGAYIEITEGLDDVR